MARGIKSLGGLGGGSFHVLDSGPSYGDTLADAISGGLSAYGEEKKKKQTGKALMNMGFSEQEAGALSRLPPELMQLFVKQLSERGYRGAGAQQAQGGTSSPAEEIIAAQENIPGKGQLDEIGAMLRQPQGMQGNALQQLQGQPQQEPQNIFQALQQPTRKEQREEEKLQIQKSKLEEQRRQFEATREAQDQREINKDTRPFYEETIKANKGAQKALDRLNQMERINEKGEVNPGFWNAWKKFLSQPLGQHGPQFSLDWMKTADEQLFDKLAAEFVKDIKEYFPGRINEFEVRTFLKTLPQLEQTQEGRRQVIHNLKLAQEVAQEQFKVMRDIITENNGKRPANLELLVDERMEPIRERVSKQLQWKAPVPVVPGAKFTAPLA